MLILFQCWYANPRQIYSNFHHEDSDYRKNHPDPTFGEEYSFCAGERLLKTGKGKYVFFHTTSQDPKTKQDKRYIKSYFVVEDVLEGFKNPIVKRLKGGARHAYNLRNHYVILGNGKKSRVLKNPIEFNRKLAEKIEFEPRKKIEFDIINDNGRTLSDLDCISSATRNYRVLSESDVKLLLSMINK